MQLPVAKRCFSSRSPLQGLGQSPKVLGLGQSPKVFSFSPSPTKYGGFVKKDREVLTEGTRFDIIK